MIEPTDEMLAAFLAAWDRENRIINESAGEYVEAGARDRAGLAAVLALIERDHVVLCSSSRPRDDMGYGDLRCTKRVGHVGEHMWTVDGIAVVWP